MDFRLITRRLRLGGGYVVVLNCIEFVSKFEEFVFGIFNFAYILSLFNLIFIRDNRID